MATVTRTEYISIDGLPLSTAAWETEDIASILDGPGTRGGDLTVPTRAGAVARRRTLEPREISIPIAVNGWFDSDGGAHADPREGLLANLDELKKHFAPQYTTTGGTRTLLWDNGAGIYRSAEVHVSPAIQVSMLGPYAARAVISATIPAGVLRDGSGEAPTTISIPSGTTSITFTVSNGCATSTGQIEDARIYFGGTATWPGPSALIVGSGAPAPGSGTTGAWYYDDTDALTPLYGPRAAGGTWPGPYEVQFTTSTPPDVYNITRAPYMVYLDPAASYAPTSVYGPRTIANPNASNIKIENLTYDSTGAVYIQYNDAIAALLIIDNGEYTATKGGSDVSGSIVNAGTPLWLPLVPGDNVLRVTLSSNTANAALNVLAQAVFL